MRHLPLLISLGLLAACGNGASASKEEGVSVPASDVAASATGAGGSDAVAAGAAQATPTTEPDANKPASLSSLPLKRGFFVSSDTPCAQASNATLMLVKRDGINASRTPCEFTKIEKTGPTSYRVTEACNDNGSAWGREDMITSEVLTFEIKSETAFTAKSESGWERSARYCPQARLPEPWRTNDIADIIN